VPVLRYYYRARPSGLPVLDKLLKLLLYYWCLGQGYRKLVQRWGAKPDLVHVHVLLRTGLAALWWQWRHDLPYVITEHWTLYLPQNAGRISALRRWLTRWVVRRATALHTVSRNLQQALSALDIRNGHHVVIPNVVDTNLFQPASEAAYGQLGGILLHVAAFNEQAKNLTGILRTVARLEGRHPGLQLRIAGYGPQEAVLRRLATDLGLLDRIVFFLGKLSPAAVAAEMRRATCLVLFSNYENLPCVLIEAQASGLPAVATRVGGVPELLPPNGAFGLLVPPTDERALEQALEAALAKPNQFAPQRMRQHAVTHFSYEAVGQQFADLYASILRPTGGQISVSTPSQPVLASC
jgi:glycosyltransferase involved in cell wall biosynthesis